MSEKPLTRRDVLRTASTATAITGLGAVAGSARSGQSAHVVEAGIRYETPNQPDLRLLRTDSRPPYTVDKQNRRLLMAPNAGPSGELASTVGEGKALVAERPTEPGQSQKLQTQTKVKELPVGLTSRMRPRERLVLSEPIKQKRIQLNYRGKETKLQVTGESTRTVEPGSDHAIRLDSEQVTAQTVSVVDDPVTDPDVPEFMRANKRVSFGERSIEVTPTVEIVHHGELSVVSRQIA